MGKDLSYGAMLGVYGAMLTDRQRDIMESYYWDDLSLGEISENSGVTRQAVRDSVKHGEKKLAGLEEKLGFCEKAKKCSELFEEILRTDDPLKVKELALKGTEIF